MGLKIRKSVADLTAQDLSAHGAWEFALDEEGDENQDETTVRPVEGHPDPQEGMIVIRARFTLANGRTLPGYLTPPRDGDDGLGTVQPVVTTPQGQVLFWWGMIAPDEETRASAYRKLGSTNPSDVFPVAFESDVPIAGGPVRGLIPGFIVLEDFRTGRTRVER